MATKISSIYTLISADDKPLKSGIESARKASVDGASKIQRALNRINFKAVAIGITAMAGTAAFAIKKFLDLAANQERVEIRLAAVLKATGQAAGYNITQLKAMASAMQSVTTVGDETILQAMALLATFKNVRGEAFERTTMAALDLAEVTGQDLMSAMMQLAKAMNDPISNLGALSRAGIQFSADQKKMIKELWEAGQVFKAQGIILNELESQFGGTAKAARNTFGGALQALKNTMSDVGEKIGFALMPPIQKLIERFQKWLEVNDKLINQDIPGTIETIGRALVNTYQILESFGKLWNQIFGSSYKSVKEIELEYLKKQETMYVRQIQHLKKVGEAYEERIAKLGTIREKIRLVTQEIKNQAMEYYTLTKAQSKAMAPLMKIPPITEQGHLPPPPNWPGYANPFSDKALMDEKKYFQDVNKNIQTMQSTYESATWSMTSAFSQFVQTGKLDFKSLIASVLADLARLQISKFFASIGTALFSAGTTAAGAETSMQHGGFIGERIQGFGMKSGKSYEFHPNEFVIPQDKMGGNNVEVVINNNSGQQATTTETVGPDNTKRIMVWIGQDIMNRGPIHKAITNSFVVQPRGRTT